MNVAASKAVEIDHSYWYIELKSPMFVRGFLLSNVCSNLLKFKAYSRNSIPSRPEMLA
jgi:hypothetical protein